MLFSGFLREFERLPSGYLSVICRFFAFSLLSKERVLRLLDGQDRRLLGASRCCFLKVLRGFEILASLRIKFAIFAGRVRKFRARQICLARTELAKTRPILPQVYIYNVLKA